MRSTRLVQALVALPLVLLALTACGDDSTAPTSGDGGSETTDSGGGNDAEPVDIADVDLCTLVSDETLAAANLSAADGVAKEWVYYSNACVFGEDKPRRLIVLVDDAGAGDLTNFYDELTEIAGHEAAVEYDSEMTCQLIFDVGETRLQVLVEDLGFTDETPGEPCDTGYPAAEDVIAALGG
ncbi:MAG TPA: DUF3558 family protein [Jiangellaceae bacterium]